MNPWDKKHEIKNAAVADVLPPVATPPLVAVSVQPEPQKQIDPTVILSNVDAHIYERLKEQPKTLAEIEIKTPKYENVGHMLRLPKELEAFKNKYSFKWIYKNKKAIDHNLDNLGFSLVNRIYFTTLPRHLFSAQGCIERGDAILGFTTVKRAEFLRSEPGRISMERVKNLPIEKWKDGGEQYYKPDLTQEKDGEQVVAGIQPDAADFNQT